MLAKFVFDTQPSLAVYHKLTFFFFKHLFVIFMMLSTITRVSFNCVFMVMIMMPLLMMSLLTLSVSPPQKEHT